ncbi:Chromatin assembly factor 1 subunit rlf2 [Madurella mycetomatis]|uniref:Chromatin assembly factor 1 subunit rlf2 n=1 Tax=Madurella mycetomatis TaxID=100816 RepID=A0A175VYV9_9PEZI|nr:Chromatin assembly factor 1 subunit rlf2 [Madurella mycetomatis]
MSANVEERDLTSRKRSHEAFSEQEDSNSVNFHSLSDKENNIPFTSAKATASSPAKSSPGLTESGSSPLDRNSPSPNPTPNRVASVLPATASPLPKSAAMAKDSAQTTTGEPLKKKRLTPEERKAKLEAEEARKKEREAERERKRREREEAEKQKSEQKAAKVADKERKKREKEEEEAKKARSQMKLTSMFKTAPVTPKKETSSLKTLNGAETARAGSSADAAPRETSLYEQMFKPFFVKEHVRLAPNPFEIDEETRAAKTKILDEYVEGKRGEAPLRFNPLEALQIPYSGRRGRVYPSVRKIMAEFHGITSNAPIDLTTESQNAQILHTREALKSVPVKSIKFREDVRPPYIGTISGLPPGVPSLRKLARKPISRDLLPLNYDYDSEAEWQEEDGEDVDDLDDEEDEADNDEDMADFLDDSEDVGPARMVFSGGIEPESSGLCWENRKRFNTQPQMQKYRMEFILESLEHHHSIDPFSTAYWEAPKPKTAAETEKSSVCTPAATGQGLASSKSTQDARGNKAALSAAPSDAFQALNPGSEGSGSMKKSQQPLPPDLQEALKGIVRRMPNLSKIGVIEFFAADHPKCSKAQIKSSFDSLFEKAGKGFKVKGE